MCHNNVANLSFTTTLSMAATVSEEEEKKTVAEI